MISFNRGRTFNVCLIWEVSAILDAVGSSVRLIRFIVLATDGANIDVTTSIKTISTLIPWHVMVLIVLSFCCHGNVLCASGL